MTLTEFLLARYTADESRFGPEPWTDPIGDTEEWAAGAGNRVLAQCAAGRRIVEDYARLVEVKDRNNLTEFGQGSYVTANSTVRLLALAYADHPDYREEWKP